MTHPCVTENRYLEGADKVGKVLRTYPGPEDEADFVGELVRGWCAFEGAPEDIWDVMGDDRKDVEEMKGSALEVCLVSCSRSSD
jgi:hypothetical protein